MSIPTIPDNLAKVILLASFVLIGYAAYKGESRSKKKEYSENRANDIEDSIETENARLVNLKSIYLADVAAGIVADSIKRKYSQSDILTGNFKEGFSKLYPLYKSYQDKTFEIEQQKTLYSKEIAKINTKLKAYSVDKFPELSFAIGIIFLVCGVFVSARNEILDRYLEKRRLIDKPEYYFNCQSCGKPFSSVVKYGKESDDTINHAFCSACYSNGNFVNNVSLEEFIKSMDSELNHYKQKERTRIIRRIGKLDRWRLPYRDQPVVQEVIS